MMEFQRYGFFDSEITGYDEEGFPILDRAENSDLFALYFSLLISTGVFAAPANALMVEAYEGMTIKINPGPIFIRGRLGVNETEVFFTVDPAPTSYSRITSVIARVNYNERYPEIILKNGEVAKTPVAPELLQPNSGDYYEVCLAEITISSNQTVISQANIRDTRYDSSKCGVVTQMIDSIDTSVFFAQLNAFYDDYVKLFNGDYADFILKMDSAYQNFYTKLNDLYNTYTEKYSTDYSDYAEKMLAAYNQYLAEIAAYFASLQDKSYNDMTDIVQRMAEFETEQEALWHEWFDSVKGMMSEDVGAACILRLKEHEGRLAALEEMLISGEIYAPLATEDGDVLTTESDDAIEAFWYYATK